MKCPICGKELEMKNKQVGTNDQGEPIFNEYAICRDCKKQWNLDKQRAKKAAAKKAAEKPAQKPADKVVEKPVQKPTSKAVEKPVQKPAPKAVEKPVQKPASKTAPQPAEKAVASSETKVLKKPIEKKAVEKKPVSKRTASSDADEKRYSNIPPEKVRTKRESAVRKGYEDMLATGTIDTDKVKKSKAAKSSAKTAKQDKTKYDTKASKRIQEPEVDEYDDYYEDAPRFRAMRIILGIISLAGFGFFTYKGFMTGLSSTTDGVGAGGTLYIILALCMLVSALLYFIMQKASTVFAFILPMIFYIASGVFAFLKRGDDLILLIAAIASGVLAIISLILAIASRFGNDDDEDYDDEDEDEYNYDDDFEDDDDYED